MRPIDRDPFAHRSAKQFVHRHAECLPLDVQQCVLDRCDGARIDATGGLHLTDPQRRGDLLHRARIRADQRLRQAADYAGEAAAAIGLGVFGPADNAIVSGDLEERERAPAGVAMQVIDAGDLHADFLQAYGTGAQLTGPRGVTCA